jgi:hypothetical protein
MLRWDPARHHGSLRPSVTGLPCRAGRDYTPRYCIRSGREARDWIQNAQHGRIFNPALLTEDEKTAIVQKNHYFHLGETTSSAALSGALTVSLMMYLTGKSRSLLSFTIVAMRILLLFIFLPRLKRKGMHTDTDTIIRLFRKNEQVKTGIGAYSLS